MNLEMNSLQKLKECNCEIALEDRELLTDDRIELMFCKNCEALKEDIEIEWIKLLRNE
jgi:hypothetical protein